MLSRVPIWGILETFDEIIGVGRLTQNSYRRRIEMRNSRWLTVLLILVAAPAFAAGITIEPVAVSLNTGRDPVPGRPAPFVFRGLSTVEAPVINAQGDVVFTAFSAPQFSSSSGGAFGLYLHQQGQPLRVLGVCPSNKA